MNHIVLALMATFLAIMLLFNAYLSDGRINWGKVASACIPLLVLAACVDYFISLIG